MQKAQKDGAISSVAPRALEPLISLTLSSDKAELEKAEPYIERLVWCTTIKNPRVKYQALWALVNLARKNIVEDEHGQPHDLGLGESLSYIG